MAQPALDVFRSLDQALATAVAKAAPSVVHVSRSHTGGTGIVWAPDLVISASFHTPDKTQIGVGTDGDLDLRDAEVIGRDPGTDVALLRVPSGGLTPATFREIDQLAVGNLALAIGRPGRTARASLRAIGVLGPELRTHHNGKLDRYIESDRQIPRGFEPVGWQVRAPHDVSIGRQRFEDPPRQRGRAESRVMDADRARPLQAERIEVGRQRSIIPLACAAEDEVGEHGRRAASVDGVGRCPRIDQKRHRPRLNAGHLLDQQGQSVRIRVLKISLGQFRNLSAADAR
jgi:hypothetical protein